MSSLIRISRWRSRHREALAVVGLVLMTGFRLKITSTSPWNRVRLKPSSFWHLVRCWRQSERRVRDACPDPTHSAHACGKAAVGLLKSTAKLAVFGCAHANGTTKSSEMSELDSPGIVVCRASSNRVCKIRPKKRCRPGHASSGRGGN